ncbi:MAG: hypothetical protein P4L87_14295, partial [Formivibrio sp.]|nr:hypothetical protein [Formivibrio sp.]
YGIDRYFCRIEQINILSTITITTYVSLKIKNSKLLKKNVKVRNVPSVQLKMSEMSIQALPFLSRGQSDSIIFFLLYEND